MGTIRKGEVNISSTREPSNPNLQSYIERKKYNEQHL